MSDCTCPPRWQTGAVVAVVYQGEYGAADSVSVGRYGAEVVALSGRRHRCGPESGTGGRVRAATDAEVAEYLGGEREAAARDHAAGACPFAIGDPVRRLYAGTVRDAYLAGGQWHIVVLDGDWITGWELHREG